MRDHSTRAVAAVTLKGVWMVLAVVVLGAVFGLGLAQPALAHTELVYRTLEPGSTAGQQKLLLRFSEPIDGRFLAVSILNLQGAVVQSSGVSIDQQRRTDGYVVLDQLAPGIYTVAWWTRALDGDPSNGSFVLGLGTNVAPVALLPPVGARDPAIQPAMFWGDTVWDTILHWFAYLASALLLGSLSFSLFIWRPVWRRISASVPSTDESRHAELDRLDFRVSRACRLIALAGAGFFVMSSVMLLVLQVEFVRYSLLQPITGASPTPLAPSALSHQAASKALAEILSGHQGHVWLARLGAGVFALLLAVFLLTSRKRRENWRWLLTFVGAVGAVLTISLSAHAAVIPQSSWSAFLDWSHLVVMGVWIGGLIPLLLVTRRIRKSDEGRGVYEQLSPSVAARFSTLALGAFVYMAVTGMVQAYLNVGSFGLLARTTYGQVLIAKLALFASLFIFGAVHRRLTLRRLNTRPQGRITALERILPFEFAVGASLLVAVALMASLATSRQAWPAHQELGYYSAATTAGVTATFRAVPGKAGENEIALDIADRRSGPATLGTRATVTVNGVVVELTAVQPMVVGSTQRFASPVLATLPEVNGLCSFTYERASYAAVEGRVKVVLPAVIKGAEY